MTVSRREFETRTPSLPAMRSPTVSLLFGEQGYAVKIALARDGVPALLVRPKGTGAQDILVYELTKLLP